MKELRSIEARLAEVVTELRPLELDAFMEVMGKGEPTPDTLHAHAMSACLRDARDHIEQAYTLIHRVTF